jgi:hypothetical protein
MKTLGDFVNECELYKYSKEHFELVKEASELRLMEMYLENQRFMYENPEIIQEAVEVVDENFFMESVDEDNIEALEEKFAEKTEGFRKKLDGIWTTLYSIWKSFIKPFINGYNRILKAWDSIKSGIRAFKNNRSFVKACDEKINSIFEQFHINFSARDSRKLVKAIINTEDKWPPVKVIISGEFCPNALTIYDCNRLLNYPEKDGKTLINKLNAANLRKGVEYNWEIDHVGLSELNDESEKSSGNSDFLIALKAALGDTIKLHTKIFKAHEKLNTELKDLITEAKNGAFGKDPE